MKRIIGILLILVMCSSLVMAQGKSKGKDMAEPVLYDEGGMEVPEGQPEAVAIDAKPTGASKLGTVPGLENALSRVKNERAREVLQRNLDRWIERYEAKMAKLENLEVEEVNEESGDVTLKAEQPVKYFGFIKGKATKRFEISNGKINERAPWYSLFYSEVTD